MRWLDGIADSMDMSLSKLQEGDGEGQGSLGCCSPWNHKELDMTERLNWTKVWEQQEGISNSEEKAFKSPLISRFSKGQHLPGRMTGSTRE